MKSLLSKLQTICNLYPLKRKTIIVESHAIGEELIEAISKHGQFAINLSYKTTRDIALEYFELHSTTPGNFLEHTVGTHLTYQFLNKLRDNDQLRYFSKLEITPSFSHAIYQTIQTLRLANFTSKSLKAELFLSPEKGEDIVLLMTEFEHLLQSFHFMDDAELYRKVMSFEVQQDDEIFILQSNLPLTQLEEQFLTKLLNENVYKLPLEHVYGIDIPERTSLRSISWEGTSPFSYLYQPGASKEKANLAIFIAKTEDIEVKRIVKVLIDGNTKLDEVAVYYTNPEPYVTLFYHLSESMSLPITFGEGISVSYSRPGRLVALLKEWIQSNYSLPVFLTMLNENIIELEDGAPSKVKIMKYLRDCQIGWGKDRYVSRLQAEMNRLNEKMEQQDSSSNIERYETRIREISWLMQMFKKMFNHLPAVESTINFKSLLSGIDYFLSKIARATSITDQSAKIALLEEIQKIIPYSNQDMKNYDAFEKLMDLLMSVKINRSRPKPGHLHVTSFKQGIYQNRSKLFIVGLDNRRFPGDSSENPLLLDAERMKLASGLPLMREKGKETIYTMLQVFAQAEGDITASFSNFDIGENRTVSPAHLFLQCYRMVINNHNADYQDLSTVSVCTSAPVIEPLDFWSKELNTEQSRLVGEDILNQFPNIRRGRKAEVARNTDLFTEFDGRVNLNPESYDPRINLEKKMTAGKLETLATCPYSYFLQEILGVRPVEEVHFDPYRWLDPPTRGSLIHEIFETFYKNVTENAETPCFNTHKAAIIEIANDLIQKQTVVTPPPSQRVFEKETEDIYNCCMIFLKEEEEHCKHHSPKYFEYSFGIGSIEPAKILLPSGEIMSLAGKIDRVDETNVGKYHIIDYKTGSTYGYGMNKPFKGGRQLQHFVYALAIEQHLKLADGAVEESSYFFPTTKGYGQRFSRKQDHRLRENGLDLLEKLINVIRSGQFPMTDDANDCTYCKFQAACRRSFYDPSILEAKRMDQSVNGLNNFRGVRAYE